MKWHGDWKVIGDHGFERTWLTASEPPRVVKAIALEPDASSGSLRLPRVDCVPTWQRFTRPSAALRTELDLDEGKSWVLAERLEVPGRDLSQVANPPDPLVLAGRLATTLRDLHEQGIVHGDIQPRNVIVGASTWLIDVSLSDETQGQVSGAAPLMAPELWEGALPSPSSDAYALATLISWAASGTYPLGAATLSDWATAHRTGEPRVSDVLPSRVAGVLGRMLSRSPEDRPSLQRLLDALEEEGLAPIKTRVVAGIMPYAPTIDVLTAQATVGSQVSIQGNPANIAEVLEETRLRLEFDGWRSAHLSSRQPGQAPWTGVFELAESLDSARPGAMGGDQLHVFQTLTSSILENVDSPTVITFAGFATAGPDLQAWWEHLAATVVMDQKPVFLLRDGPEVALPEVSAAEWSQWRATTLRTDVRDLPQRRWDQLVENHGAHVSTLLNALNRELGIAMPSVERTFDTAGLVAIGKGWRVRVDALIQQCAFGEAVSLCEALARSLHGRSTGKGLPDLDEVLELWTDATLRGSRTAGSTDRLRTALEESTSPRAKVLLAQVLNGLGRHADGLETLLVLRESLSSEDDQRLVAEVDAWRAQLALSSGQLENAARYAREGLNVADDDLRAEIPEIIAHLEILVRAPDALAGKTAAIEGLRDLIPTFDSVSIPAVSRARTHSYCAIGLTRNGEFDEATDAHLRALEVVESAGLLGELPTYLLNVGTAYNRQGRLGLAREYYARGTRTAQPTTRASTRALLLANQANVDLALGRLDEASTLVERALDVALEHTLTRIEVMCRSVEADILVARNDAPRAYQAYESLLIRDDLSVGQRAELLLAAAATSLELQAQGQAELTQVQQHLDRARTLIDASKLADLEHQHGILRARLTWCEGGDVGVMAGIELYRRHLLAAKNAGNHKLVLRESPHLVSQLQKEGLHELLDEVSEIAQHARNAIAMGLTRELRRDFFSNLGGRSARAPKPQAPAPVEAPLPATDVVERFYRMLSLNEMILRSTSLGVLFETALDIALSLSGAERGFVLLRETQASRIGQFKVASSRDVDGEAIAKPHLKVSLTIAEEAAQTGRTVITLNAQDDARFNSALSVVDLDLTSVLCVPIRDGSGLLGALYVDHRFRPGVFGGEVPRMMEAFGHQLALAITNARRIEDLEHQRQKLQVANDELDGLLTERETMMKGLEARVSQLSNQVERASETQLHSKFSNIVFASRPMEVVLDQVSRVSRGDIPVVIQGESGVGKELVARAIHDASPRAASPFVAFNCGAVSESLFESEVFGHIRGAFTGADYNRDGLFLAAEGGTIFLDEVGEMPMSMQVKILRVLQERQIRRVGEATTRPVDVRVVAATNRDLWEMVEAKTFRQDLFFRLAAFVIRVPPLRERREDIPLIAQHILKSISLEAGGVSRLSTEGARLLTHCEWLGNVRQLENTLRSAVVLSQAELLGEAELAPLIRLPGSSPSPSAPRAQRLGRRSKANRQDVVEAMRRAGDDREVAAEALGVSVRTLFRYLAKYNI